jgi:hypothetical protein
MATLANLQAYTTGSDIALAFQPNQLTWGRTGNDIVIGYNTINRLQGGGSFDILIGDIETPQLVEVSPRNWQNKYILGDWKKPYYTNGNPLFLGLDDFAIIADFEPSNDIIQLHGKASDYQTLDFYLGTVIWHKQEILPGITVPDVVTIIPTTGLDLNASYFQYVGYTPPALSLLEAKQLGGEGFEIGFGITSDRQGNVYVVGGTSSDLSGPNQGNRDVWFAKYDGTGNEIWRKQFGSTSFDFAFGIAVDPQGYIYLTGSTEGNLFNAKSGEVSDAWLAKFDNNGTAVWQKQFGNEGFFTHNSYAIDVDARGNVSLSGVSVESTAEGAILPTTDDAWVARFDTNGNQQWFQQFGTPNDLVAFDESYTIALDKEDNIFTAGFTTAAIGSTPYNGLYDAWLAKNDKNGNQLWAKNIGTTDFDWAWAVDTDSKDNVYVTGWTLGNLGGINAGSYDAWLAKYDNDGNQKWVRQFGTSGDDEAFGVKVDSLDNVYVIGYTDRAFRGKTNKGDYDAWVTKFDKLGNQQWVQQFGTAGTDHAYDITVSDSSVYITGITDGSLGTANEGSFDAWVVKLNGENGNIENFTDTLNSYIQPQKQASEILASTPTLGQFSQSVSNQTDELFTSVPKDVDLLQLATNASAQIFNTTPDVLANYSSLQKLSANLTPSGEVLTPSGGVGTTSLDPTNQLLTQFSNVEINSLLLPSAQPSIFNLPTPN